MTQGSPVVDQNQDSGLRAWHIGFNNETWMDLFLRSGSASMGWPQVNKDISKLQTHESIVDATDASESVHPRNPAVQLRKFAHEAKIGDIIVLKDGLRYHSDEEWGGNGNIRAIGVIDGEYTYTDAHDYYEELPTEASNMLNEHHRNVRWVINFDEQLGGPFTPKIAFNQWTFDELEGYPTLREQIISSRGLHAKFSELEEYATNVAQSQKEEQEATVWIEKSYHNREDRKEPGWGLGDALWCPQTRTDGGSSIYYENATHVKKGDIIIHLDQDQRAFTGASIAADDYEETTCLENTEWDRKGVSKMGYDSGGRPAYRVPLKSYQELPSPLDVDAVLDEENNEVLHELRRDHTVVYSKNLNLNQGAYLTKSPPALVDLINDAAHQHVDRSIPHLTANFSDRNVQSDKDEEKEKSAPHETVDSISEATTLVVERFAETDYANPLQDVSTNRIKRWTLALRGFNPGEFVTVEDEVEFQDLETYLEANREQFEEIASEISITSLNNMDPAEVVFLALLRDRQKSLIESRDLDIQPNANQPKLNAILRGAYLSFENPSHPVIQQVRKDETTVYRQSAPVDYWIPVLRHRACGIGESDYGLWAELNPGDILVFHANAETIYSGPESDNGFVFGVAVIGERFESNENWWNHNYVRDEKYPYRVAFDRLFLTSGAANASDLTRETTQLGKDAVSTNIINNWCLDATDSNFPVNHFLVALDDESKYGRGEIITDRLVNLTTSVSPVATTAEFTGTIDPDAFDGIVFPDAYDLPTATEISEQITAAVRSGDHIIFTGPPGTGKTEIAQHVTADLVKKHPNLYSGYQVTTATADWSTFDTVGGYMPTESAGDDSNGDLAFTPGIVLNRIKDPQTGAQSNEPIIIDELNRADIDKGFGQLFTLLSGQPVKLPYTKDEQEIELLTTDHAETTPADHQYVVPDSWHIFATMNSYDKTSLYEMSYAFMRRFAFIRIPAPSLPEGDDEEALDTLDEGMQQYIDAWKNIDPTPEERRAVGLVWKHTNQAVENRAIGPAIVKDMLGYITNYHGSQNGNLKTRVTNAAISYIFPQLEGVPERTQIVSHIADVDDVDRGMIETAAQDMLQVTLDSES